mgnify:FL=1
MLQRLLRRATAVTFERRYAGETLKAIAALQGPGFVDLDHSNAFATISSNVAALADAVETLRMDPAVPEDGRRLAFVCHCVTQSSGFDEAVWQQLMRRFEDGLVAAKWEPGMVRTAATAASRWGVYPPTLPAAVEQYIAAKVSYASALELVHLANALAAFSELLPSSSTLLTICQRAIVATDQPHLPPSTIVRVWGTISRHASRGKCRDLEVYRSLLRHIPTISRSADARCAASMLALAALHHFLPPEEGPNVGVAMILPPSQSFDAWDAASSPAKAATDGGAAAGISSSSDNHYEVIRTLLTTVASTLVPDAEVLIVVLRSLLDMPKRVWLCHCGTEMDLVLSAISRQSQALLMRRPFLPVEALVGLMPKFFSLIERRPLQVAASPIIAVGAGAFCEHITLRQEELISHQDSPPFFLVPGLLGSSLPQAHQCAVQLVREAALQQIALPTLQTFRFILLFTDAKAFDVDVQRYLRQAFALSTTGIPLIQLCTAVRCFAQAVEAMDLAAQSTGGDVVPAFTDDAERQSFLIDVVATYKRQGYATVHVPCAVTLLGSLQRLRLDPSGSEDAKVFLIAICKALHEAHSNVLPPAVDRLSAHQALELLLPATNRKILFPPRKGGDPETSALSDSASTAAAATSRSPFASPALLAFLDEVARTGTVSDANVKASTWMRDNDPNNDVLPRTPEQVKADALMAKLAATRSDDRKGIDDICKQYLLVVPALHGDELSHIFVYFADKVIKNDSALRDVIRHMVLRPSVPTLSPRAIGVILGSCAQLRFSFYGTMKDFVSAITEDQWQAMSAAELEIVASAMAKLSLRVNSVMLSLAEQISAATNLLNERQVTSLIASLQQLGFADDQVYRGLVKKASQLANTLSAVSLGLLLAGPNSHRLPLTDETVLPLLNRLSRVAGDVNPQQLPKIATTLRKANVSRELLLTAQGISARLTAGRSGGGHSQTHQMALDAGRAASRGASKPIDSPDAMLLGDASAASRHDAPTDAWLADDDGASVAAPPATPSTA